MKLQAATEYLTSYGWTVLIVALVLIGLYYIGVFSNKPVSNNCIFPGGAIACSNINMAENGLITVDMQQNGAYPINVTEIGCNTDEAQITPTNDINPPSNIVYMIAHQTYPFSLQCYNLSSAYSGSPGSAFRGYLAVYYTDTYTNLPVTAYAQVEIKVS